MTLDFPFHIFNNYDVRQVNLIRHAPSSKGRNRVINNEMSDGVRWFGLHNNGEDNLDYINIDFLNNSAIIQRVVLILFILTHQPTQAIIQVL